MKRIAAAVLCLLLLSGCSGEKTFSQDGLTLTLHSGFTDLSEEAYAAGTAFLYGYGNLAILGIREDKALLARHGLAPTLADYAQMVISANGRDVPLGQTDGVYHFTYEATVEGTACTYLTVVLEGADCFWTLQGYCPTVLYPSQQAALWGYLTSARIDK